jgi:hypothetical protein
MQYLQAKTTDGKEIVFEREPITSGGEKVVFFTKDHQNVIGFFFGKLDDPHERRSRLHKIVGEYNPTSNGAQADFWKRHFCWPTAIVDGEKRIPPDFIKRHHLCTPVLGVICPAYRPNFFFRDKTGNVREKKGRWFTGEKSRKLLPDSERGDLLRYLQTCSIMASSVRRLHFGGLAHSDLSHSNVLIDPKHGDACVIDIDSLVVPGLAPPSVLGTPGYIAPEVVTGKALPSIETDLHALAVLIYETLLLRHPLQGPKIHAKSPEEDELLSMGAKALYIEHPEDRSNHPKKTPAISAARLGPHMDYLFQKTFIHGLHNPRQRATASEWEKGLTKTLDLIHPSPEGKSWFVLTRNLPKTCPYTNRSWTAPVPIMDLFRNKGGDAYSDEQHSVTIWNNRYLYKWHVYSNVNPLQTDREPQAYFSYYQDRWWMVNQSGDDMILVDEQEYLRDGHAVELTPDLKVLFSPEDGGRLAIFSFID